MKPEFEQFLPTRQSLLSRLKRWDDQESWQDFFQTYWRLIYSTAVKAGLSDAEAQEVVQETVITVSNKMGTFTYDPAKDSFKGWLLYVTRKAVAMQFRQRDRLRGGQPGRAEVVPVGENIEQVAAPAGEDLEAIWEEQWQANLFELAVTRVKELVNPRQYQMFTLYVLKAQSAGDVARTFDVNLAQVYLAKYRVAKLIKQQVRELERRSDCCLPVPHPRGRGSGREQADSTR